MRNGRLGPRKWTEEAVRNEAGNHQTRGSFQNEVPGAYNTARSLGILDDLFKDKPNKGYARTPDGTWSDEENLQAEARKYASRQAFAKGAPGAYDAALNKGILDKLFENHENNGYTNSGPKGHITLEFCRTKASGLTRGQFKAQYPSAYRKAREQDWLDVIFADHRWLGYTSEAMMLSKTNRRK
jgi:hypothetical protein